MSPTLQVSEAIREGAEGFFSTQVLLTFPPTYRCTVAALIYALWPTETLGCLTCCCWLLNQYPGPLFCIAGQNLHRLKELHVTRSMESSASWPYSPR